MWEQWCGLLACSMCAAMPGTPPESSCRWRSFAGRERLENITGLFKELSEFPEIDTSYFLPWSLDMLYQVEAALKQTAARTVS